MIELDTHAARRSSGDRARDGRVDRHAVVRLSRVAHQMHVVESQAGCGQRQTAGLPACFQGLELRMSRLAIGCSVLALNLADATARPPLRPPARSCGLHAESLQCRVRTHHNGVATGLSENCALQPSRCGEDFANSEKEATDGHGLARIGRRTIREDRFEASSAPGLKTWPRSASSRQPLRRRKSASRAPIRGSESRPMSSEPPKHSDRGSPSRESVVPPLACGADRLFQIPDTRLRRCTA